MTRKIIGLSIAIENEVVSGPKAFRPKVKYFGHAETADRMAAFFPGLTRDDLPDGEGWAVETIELSTHNGTHLDAPYHFVTTMDGGKRAITIDEVPLDWCMGPGVKFDFRHFDDGYVVTAEDVERELARIGHALAPKEIVVANTRAGEVHGGDGYVDAGCGMGGKPLSICSSAACA